MKKLPKRFAITIVAAGISAAVGAPAQANEHAEQEYQRLLDGLSSVSGMSFVNQSYEKGGSESTAITRVQLGEGDDAEELFMLQHEISHPDDDAQSVTINTTLHMQEQNSAYAELSQVFVDETPIRLVTEFVNDEEAHNRLTVSAVDTRTPGRTDEGIYWNGLEFDMVTKADTTVGKGNLGALHALVPNEGVDFKIANAPVSIDLVAHEDVRYTGTADIALETISISAPQLPVPVSLDSIKLETASSIEGDGLDSSALLSFIGIDSILPLNSASLDVKMNGLGIDGVRQMNDLVASVSEGTADEIDQSQLKSDLAAMTQALLPPGSLTSMELALDNDGGSVLADVVLAMKNVGEDGMTAESLSKVLTPRDLLKIINLDGKLNADTSALALTPIMIFIGAAGQFLTVTEESVTSIVTLEDSTLNVNGVQMPLDGFLGDLDTPFEQLLGIQNTR